MDTQKEHEETNLKLNQLKGLIAMDIVAGTNSGKNLGKKSTRLKFWTISFSVILTIILGIKFGDWWTHGSFGANIALILSAILTGLNSWDAFAKYEMRTIQERANTNKLTILFKKIVLYQSGNNAMKLEEYYILETSFQQLQDEYLEERKALQGKPNEQQITGNNNIPA